MDCQTSPKSNMGIRHHRKGSSLQHVERTPLKKGVGVSDYDVYVAGGSVGGHVILVTCECCAGNVSPFL